MSIQLRPYQRECVDAVWNHVRKTPAPAVAVLPTGAGKGVVLAQLAKDVVGWKGRMVIAAHVKELLEQTAGNIMTMAPEIPVGIYSAGLGSRDLGYPVTVAGIQSIYNKVDALGKVDVIAIDEAHRIPPDGEGQYRTFLDGLRKLNPNVRLIGLTATPYRLGTGMIYGEDQLFEKVCYEAYVRKLIVDGYLSKLKSKTTKETADVSGVTIRGGEFVQGELQAALMSDHSKICSAILEIGEKTQQRKSVIVFCSGVDHARTVANYMREYELGEVREIYGDTPSEERARFVKDFREGRVKYLVNVDVLTTGFDAPGVDCVSILRPTMSPGLFYQMVGRGFRLAPGKEDCLVLDFGGNLLRHGPVDRMLITQADGNGRSPVNPWKECPECLEVLPRSATSCLDCGYQMPREERGVGHDGRTNDKEVLSGPEPVGYVEYTKHFKKNAPEGHPPTLRVDYHVGYMYPVSEWICLEHKGGFGRQKAVTWWRERSDRPVPTTIDEALAIINTEGIKEPRQLELRSEGQYWRVNKYLDMQPGKAIASTADVPPGEDVAF
jgi:DNA repair protein RadD